MVNKNYPRGSVVLAHFPFEERPSEPGPMKHFCIVVDCVERNGQALFALCYGTSRLDETLLESHCGAIVSISNQFVKVQKGFIEGPVTHYVLDHVALVPGSWIDDRFEARFDFMREEHRKDDPIRQRLFKVLEACEPAMQMGALKPSGTLKQQAHQACQRARRSAKELRVDVGKSSTSTTPKALCDLDHLGFFLVRVEMRGRVGRVRS